MAIQYIDFQKEKYDPATAPFRALFVGPNGSGKTTAALTWPHPYFIDLDDGAREISVRMGIDFFGAVISEPNITVPTGFKDVKDIIEVLKKREQKENNRLIETVVLDSWSRLEAYAVYKIMKDKGKPGALPEYTDLGPVRSMVERIIHELLQLPYNIIVICHDTRVKDELRGRVWITPAAVGQLSSHIGKDFSEQWVFETEQAKVKGETTQIFRAYTGGNIYSPGKSRSIGSHVISPPTYQGYKKILDKVRSKVEVEEDES